MNLPKAQARGFTLIEIMIVVAIIGILATVGLASYTKARSNAQKQTCIKNLSTIDSAKQMWGLETGKTEGDTPAVSDLIGPDSFIKTDPQCPGGGTYSYNAIGTGATCTKFAEGHSL